VRAVRRGGVPAGEGGNGATQGAEHHGDGDSGNTRRRLMRDATPPPQPPLNSSATLSEKTAQVVCTLRHGSRGDRSICQLKYRYFRFLDTKRFTELGQLLTDDATTSYQSGELSYQGRDAIVAFLEESLGSGDIVTMHNGHTPRSN